jgi:hypothetical protein
VGDRALSQRHEIAANMPTFFISDRGLLIRRGGPAQALEDSAALRRAVVRALEILQPVVRPLALEITLGPLDPETFAVTPAESRRIASRAIPPGVANLSAFEQPAEIELVETSRPTSCCARSRPRSRGGTSRRSRPR